MVDDQNIRLQGQQEEVKKEEQRLQQNPATPSVRVPSGRRVGKKSKKGLIVAIVVVILLILGGLGWFILREPSIETKPEEESVLSVQEFQQPTVPPTPTAARIARSEVVIEVLNGTGIPREAGLLQTKLGGLGYENIEVANADQQDRTSASATFSSSLSSEAVDEITELLEDVYKSVDTKTSSALEVDAQIITGIRKDYVPPTATPTSEPTPTPEEAGTPTPTGSVTPTQTPTPTP
jgi:hypothetical protein